MKRISNKTKIEKSSSLEKWDTQIDPANGDLIVVETAEKMQRRKIDPKVFAEEIEKNNKNILKLQNRNEQLETLLTQYDVAKKELPKFKEDKKIKS